MRLASVLLLASVAWCGFLVLEVEAKESICYFDPDSIINKSGGSACSFLTSDVTRFWGCPCKIDMNVSLAVWGCAGFRVSVDGVWIPNPNPTWAAIYNLDCFDKHHSFAIVTCSTNCGGVNQSFIVAEYKGECNLPCNGQGQFLQSGPPPGGPA